MSKIWVRNQDKTRIIEANDFKVEQITVFNPNNNLTINNREQIVGARLLVNGIAFGKYDRIERAIEVLDEIQQLLMGRLMVNFKPNKTKVKESQTDTEMELKPVNYDVVYQLPPR